MQNNDIFFYQNMNQQLQMQNQYQPKNNDVQSNENQKISNINSIMGSAIQNPIENSQNYIQIDDQKNETSASMLSSNSINLYENNDQFNQQIINQQISKQLYQSQQFTYYQVQQNIKDVNFQDYSVNEAEKQSQIIGFNKFDLNMIELLKQKDQNNIIALLFDDKETDQDSNQDLSEEAISSDKITVQKIKKYKKNKNEKLKIKEYQYNQVRKHQKDRRLFLVDLEKKENSYIFSLTKNLSQKMQFFLFCDIYIEQKYIVGKQIEQSKRADANYWKQVSKIVEHKNKNLFEICLEQTQETNMDFDNCQKFLLSLQDQYAKQVSDTLKQLQEKYNLAQETVLMIRNNQAVLDLIQRRKEQAIKKYEEFKAITLPKHKYYVYNHYVFDLRNGNLATKDVGMSDDFVKFLAINPEYLKSMISKFGIIEFLKREYKTAITISYFNQFLFNMRNMTNLLRFTSEFITLDNIEVKLSVEHQVIDLCKEFDDLNSFDCPFIDCICLILPQITEDIEQNLTQIRQEQNIDLNKLLEMDQDEIDFYYNHESQSFIKKYYNDILNRDISTKNLIHQKVDFSENKKQ